MSLIAKNPLAVELVDNNFLLFERLKNMSPRQAKMPVTPWS